MKYRYIEFEYQKSRLTGTSSNPSLQSSHSTSVPHDGVQMASYHDEPFIIGDFHHAEVEFMHLTHQKWYSAGHFPNRFMALTRFFGYTPVSRPGKLFILGGCCDWEDNWSTVWILKDHEWSKYAQLTHGRINSIAVVYGSDVTIIGGTSFDQEP